MKIISERQVLESNVIIEETIFEVLSASSESGGAICASNVGSCFLKQLLFTSCSASHGGAISINESLVFLYSSCISSCSARKRNENGGNAAYAYNCSFYIDLMSSFKCAPSSKECGDAVFQMRMSDVFASHTNFSSCIGINGECSFGSIDISASLVRYMNVFDCYESSMYLLPNSTLKYANFIDNRVCNHFIYGGFGKLKIFDSYFFGNSVKEDGETEAQKRNVEYFNCFGDISRSGVVYETQTITHKQTVIFYEQCQKEICVISILNRSCTVYFKITVLSYLYLESE